MQFSLFACGALMIVPQGHAAIIYVDGATGRVDVNDGAYFTGFQDGDPTYPSSFSGNFLVQGNEQEVSSAQPINDIPISAVGAEVGFQFFFDAQETQNVGSGGNSNRERNIITQVELFYLTAADEADGNPDDLSQALGIWSLNSGDQVHVNDVANPAGYTSTAKPLGNGADMSLTVPFSAFPAGATSSDFILLQVTLTDGDNGNDEWEYAGAYDAGSPVQLVTFNNTPSLSTNLATAASQLAIPEPSTALLGLVGALGFLRRRR